MGRIASLVCVLMFLVAPSLLAQEAPAQETPEKPVRLVWFPRFSPDDQFLLTAHGRWEAAQAGEARVWDAANGKELHTLPHPRGVRSVAWSPKGKTFATGGYGGSVRIYDAQTAKMLHELKIGVSIEVVRFLSDEKRLVMAHGNGALRIREIPSTDLVVVNGLHTGGIWGMNISSNEKLVATAGKDTFVRIFDLDKMKKRYDFKHPGETNGVAFSADNKYLFTGCADSHLRAFSVDSGEMVADIEAHDGGGIPELQFSSDGKRLVSCGNDRTARLWDTTNLKSPKLLRTFRGHDSLVFGVALSSDGKRLATAGWDEKVVVWDAETGDEVWSWKR